MSAARRRPVLAIAVGPGFGAGEQLRGQMLEDLPVTCEKGEGKEMLEEDEGSVSDGEEMGVGEDGEGEEEDEEDEEGGEDGEVDENSQVW